MRELQLWKVPVEIEESFDVLNGIFHEIFRCADRILDEFLNVAENFLRLVSYSSEFFIKEVLHVLDFLLGPFFEASYLLHDPVAKIFDFLLGAVLYGCKFFNGVVFEILPLFLRVSDKVLDLLYGVIEKLFYLRP